MNATYTKMIDEGFEFGFVRRLPSGKDKLVKVGVVGTYVAAQVMASKLRAMDA